MAESGERARFDFTTGEDPAALVLGVMSGEQAASGRPAPRSSDGRPLMVNNIYVQNAYGLDDLDRKVSQAMTRSLSRVLPRKS